MSVILSKPAFGWSTFKLSSCCNNTKKVFQGRLSYIEDIPDKFLTAFKIYLEFEQPVIISCDEEGSSFSILLEEDISVIARRDSTTIIDFDITSFEFIYECLRQFALNLSEWVEWTWTELDPPTQECKEELSNRIKEIKNLLIKRMHCDHKRIT